MMPPPTVHPAPLPEALRRQFGLLEKRLWRLETLVAICGAAGAILISYALQFVSDRFWDTPAALRLALALAGLGGAGWFVGRWLDRWVWRRRDFRAMAVLVQSHHRRLGDRLLGIVELADEQKRPSNFSPALCQAAIHQVAAEAGGMDFRAAVATRQPRLYSVALLALMMLLAGPWLIAPQASWNALLRWLLPVGAVPRYTFVSLDQLPARKIVPHGEPFEIPCAASFHSFWRPTQASCQFERQPPIRAAVSGGHVLFRVPGQTQRGFLTLRIGDAVRRVEIVPTFRPELKNLAAQVHLPEYLGYPDATETVRNGSLSLLEGSRVAFQGEASRPLAGAVLEEKERRPLSIRQSEFTSGALDLADTAQCVFRWRDTLGLSEAAPWKLALQWQKDLPPLARCPDLAAATAMLEDEVLEIKLEGEDDYGVRELSANWQCFGRGAKESRDGGHAPLLQQQAKIRAGAPREKKVAGTYRFCPALLHIPADTTVTFCALASDYAPGRPPSQSFQHRIYVLSREEHARLIEQQFEALLAQLEEIARKQDALNGDSRRTRELPDDKLAGEEAARQLAEEAAEQSNQEEKLAQLTREGMETLKEALRNPDLSEDLLREWAEHLQKLKDLSAKMGAASRTLQRSRQNAAERARQLDAALELQKEILQALQEMLKKMGNSADDLLAQNLAQRLRKVARLEKDASGRLEKMFPETVGKKTGELSPKNQAATTQLADGQDLARKESGVLQEEIDRYFQRTQLASYGEVAQQMTASRATEELGRVAELIRQNIGNTAMQETLAWSKNFSQWANQLDARDRRRALATPNTLSEEEMKQMLAMLQRMLSLMRIRQQEENLRERTRMLESQKENNPRYREDAQALASQQRELAEETKKIQQELGDSPAGQRLGDVGQAMGEARSLLDKPQTDQPTVEAENKAIDQLSRLIAEMMSQCQGGPGGQCLGSLLQMMGMGNGGGRTPGGSMAGGDTDRLNLPVEGDRNGNAADPRAANRASGRDSRPLPMEFRDALQNYFNAIEPNGPADEK